MKGILLYIWLSPKFYKVKRFVKALFFVSSLLVIISKFLPDSYYWVSILNSLGSIVISCSIFFMIYHLILDVSLSRFALSVLVLLITYIPIRSKINYNQMENSDQYDLKLVHLNVLYSNERYEGTLQKILDVSPDFISLQETNTDWFLFLKKKLAKDYPYNSLDVRYKPFSGLAVFSKYPIKNLKLWYVENLPVLSGFIEKDGTSVYFLSTHTHSPIRPWKFRSRNRHIEAVAGHLKGINSEKMILGDFNAVPWDSHILDFIKTASVVDSRDRHRPTFPSVLPLVKIPIDYVFHSPGMHCHDFKQLKQTYSDHYGIVCELSVEKQISCAER